VREAARSQASRARRAQEIDDDFWQQLTTIEHAAELAEVTPSAVHNWISRGYVDANGDRQYVTGFHIDGVRRVFPMDVLYAEAQVRLAGRGGLRKKAM